MRMRSGLRRRRAFAALLGLAIGGTSVGLTVPAAAAGTVTAACTKTQDWGTGFGASCTITNGTAASISSWRLEFDLPSGTAVTSSWDSVRTTSGAHTTFTNAGWNGTVAPGATASFGFNGSGPGWISDCLVNGAACATGGGDGGGGDTTAPSVPTGLRVTGTTSSSVSLAWNASTDNVAVTGYDVYVGGTKRVSVAGASATVSGLSAATAYTFTVRALDAAGNASAASAAASGTTASGGGGGGGSRLGGYFTEWGVYGRNYHVKNIDTSGSASKLTFINYSFGNVQNGACTLGDTYAAYDKFYDGASSVSGASDSWDAGALRGNFNQLRQLKAKYPNVKVIWSFGGWTWSGGFGQAAANPAAFAESCYRLVEDPRWADVFDGIDIDWEYPNACGLSCDTSGRESFPRLMQALRTRFGSGNLVTAAITADGSSGGKIDAANYGGAAQYVDWYNPMTYDYFGAWNPTGPTAPHSPLTSYPGIEGTGFYSDAAIQKLKAAGVPSSKLNLGIGFYGRGWTGVTQSAPGGTATGPAPGTYEQGIEDYKVLATRCPATGAIAGTSYAKCGSEWWSYDTPSSISGKMSYARTQGLGGAFFWELSGDSASGALVSAMRSGLG